MPLGADGKWYSRGSGPSMLHTHRHGKTTDTGTAIAIMFMFLYLLFLVVLGVKTVHAAWVGCFGHATFERGAVDIWLLAHCGWLWHYPTWVLGLGVFFVNVVCIWCGYHLSERRGHDIVGGIVVAVGHFGSLAILCLHLKPLVF
jgi:hypothetical protein